MASFVFDVAAKKIVDQTLNLASDTLKVMLLKATYAGDQTDANLTAAALKEIVATNYTADFGGAGRKTVTVSAVTQDDAGHRVIAKFTNLTWTALGGATNDTVGFALLCKEVTNDGASIPIALWDIADTPTNGSDFTLSFDATNGNVRFNC